MRKLLFALTLLLLVACNVEVPETRHNTLRMIVDDVETIYSIDATFSVSGRNLMIRSESPEMQRLVGDWRVRYTAVSRNGDRGFIIRNGNVGAQLIASVCYSLYTFAFDGEYIFYQVYFSEEGDT